MAFGDIHGYIIFEEMSAKAKFTDKKLNSKKIKKTNMHEVSMIISFFI